MTQEKHLKALVRTTINTVKQAGYLLNDLAEKMNWAEKSVDRLCEKLKELEQKQQSRLGDQNQLQEISCVAPKDRLVCLIYGRDPESSAHCGCWYSSKACCACGDPALPDVCENCGVACCNCRDGSPSDEEVIKEATEMEDREQGYIK